jgi:hypothetical protein
VVVEDQYIGHPNKKINKEILELNHTKDQMDLADVYRLSTTTFIQHTFFRAVMELSPKLVIS